MRGLAQCNCPPTSPCPSEASDLVERLPNALVAWSAVTGECLPWGPLGPAGLLLAGAIVSTAISSPVPRAGKDLDQVRTRRSREVEGSLRSLDARAKANVPFVWAAVALILSAPRDTNGIWLSFFAIALGAAIGVARRATN